MNLKSNLNFVKTALNNHKIGTLMPSSKYVIKKIIKKIKPDSKFIVEYGAGNGAITKEILNILPPDGKLIVIEINENFIKELKKINDSRLTIIQADAIEASKNVKALMPKVDISISTLPFTIIKKEQTEKIIKNIHESLSEGGVFIICQHIPIVFRYLKKLFREIKWNFEIRNSIPYFIFTMRK